jgi:[ribosomal protein S18]-alanine N-acetyltransferase
MTRNLTIRRAGLADVKAIRAIENQSFSSPWSRWAFLAELGQPLSHTLVVGPPPPEPWETWGYIVFWIVAEEMHILNLAVHPRRRGRGIGRALLRAGLRQARELGAAVAWLEVRPSNTPALKLYASFGFQEVGRRPRYYDDTGEDAILLTRYWEEEKGE